MPTTRNALIRYKTIDKCLQNRYKKWTLDDLIDACSEALFDFEGIDKGVSKRTIQSDIQLMRSDKLGYNAPIKVKMNKYYYYEDENYSITQLPVSEQDLDQMNQSVAILKQFKGFKHFENLNGVIQKIEDHVQRQGLDARPIIDFEKNESLKGLKYLDILYKAISKQENISITYQSFKARTADVYSVSPYLLKEFRNRWFLIGQKFGRKDLLNLALDRIQSIEKNDKEFEYNFDFVPEKHFRDTIGVSVLRNKTPETILLKINHQHAPYVLTKPFHFSQREIERDHFGVTIAFEVHHNFELEKDILGFGEAIKVIAPSKLKRSIRNRILFAADNYQYEITKAETNQIKKQFNKAGFAIRHEVYAARQIKKMKSYVHGFLKKQPNGTYSIRRLLDKIPELHPLIFNENLIAIIKDFSPHAKLTKAILFDKPQGSNWFVSWHQDLTINVQEKNEVEGFKSWTQKEDVISVIPPVSILKDSFTLRISLDDVDQANGGLKIIPGSNKNILDPKEIQFLTEHSVPKPMNIPSGAIMVMSPLLVHASSKSENFKSRKIIHLEFCTADLPSPLKWAENQAIFN